METPSIKALAVKALQGNRQGNPTEAGSFQAEDIGKPESFQVSLPKVETGKPYTIIYSRMLDDFLLLVATNQDRDILLAQGVEDTIYTSAEIQKLKGLPPESIKAHHAIKKTSPGSRIEE